MKTTMLKVKEINGEKILQIRFPKNRLAKFFKMYRIGQYVFINFPTISLLEWHPFSLSSRPHEDTLETHVKGLGNHTKKLIKMAQEKQHLWIRVDGPYGHIHMNYRQSNVLVLACGGIGATPVMGILKHIYQIGDFSSIPKRKPSKIERVYFLWTIQTEDQYNWFCQEIEKCQNASNNSGMPEFKPTIYVTRADMNDQPFQVVHCIGQRGRPDMNNFFTNLSETYENKSITVFACGPKKFVQEASDCCNCRNRNGKVQFKFYNELFEF